MNMKFTPSVEWWFGSGNKSDKKESADEKENQSVEIDDIDADELLAAIPKLTEDQWNDFLGTSFSLITKQQYDQFVVNGIVKFSRDLETKLIPQWKKMEQFKWNNKNDDPVDYSTGTIKVPGLQTAMKATGSAAMQILRSTQFTNSYNYGEFTARKRATLTDLGYKKNDVIAFLKTQLSYSNGYKAGDTRVYCTAEDHTDGYLYVINHIFYYYYDDTDKWPDLQAGEKVFLVAHTAFDALFTDGSRLVRKLNKLSGLNIYM